MVKNIRQTLKDEIDIYLHTRSKEKMPPDV